MGLENRFKDIRKEVQFEVDEKHKRLIVSKYLPIVEETTNNLKKYLKKYGIIGMVIFGGAPSVEEAVFFEDGRSKYDEKFFSSIPELADYCYNRDKYKISQCSSFQDQLEWILNVMYDSVERFERKNKK